MAGESAALINNVGSLHERAKNRPRKPKYLSAVPRSGHVPFDNHAAPVLALTHIALSRDFHLLTSAHIWHLDCEYNIGSQFRIDGGAMLGELLNIPTDTLFDMLFVLLSGGIVLTANDVAEIEQIQRELQKRADGYKGPFQVSTEVAIDF
jgi:hypothetical protein